ncbi:hypothetical protein P3T73_13080 [Kiritimatiellota bacterium B12222]|nr:hypothetical protein P3T73_13080 [Kiritimatiellota bacterium B12222]
MKFPITTLAFLISSVVFSGESSLRTDVHEGSVNGSELVNYRKTTTRRGENVIKVFEEIDLDHDGSLDTRTEMLMDAGETIVIFTHGPKGKSSCLIKPGTKVGVHKIDDDGDGLFDRLYITDTADSVIEGFRRNKKGFWDPMSDDEITEMKNLFKKMNDLMKNFD